MLRSLRNHFLRWQERSFTGQKRRSSRGGLVSELACRVFGYSFSWKSGPTTYGGQRIHLPGGCHSIYTLVKHMPAPSLVVLGLELTGGFPILIHTFRSHASKLTGVLKRALKDVPQYTHFQITCWQCYWLFEAEASGCLPIYTLFDYMLAVSLTSLSGG